MSLRRLLSTLRDRIHKEEIAGHFEHDMLIDLDNALKVDEYSCSICGSRAVEICFPVWIPANDMADKSLWEVDFEASPQEFSDKCWCPVCEDHVSLNRKEDE